MSNIEIINLVNECEKKLSNVFKEIDKIEEMNTFKIMDAFRKNSVGEIHFNMTTGYGYGDVGRDIIEKVYSDIFHTEASLVRNQFISGSHALCVALFACLRPNDFMLSITGTPYDTLHEVIGIRENSSSLISYGVNYEQIDLINDDFDYERIENALKQKKYKLIHIQRSKG